MAPQTKYQISRNGQVIGTYDSGEMIAKVATGQVMASDHYWTAGMSAWLNVSKNDEWMRHMPKSAPRHQVAPPMPSAQAAPQSLSRPVRSYSGGHDGLHPVRLHGHREPHQGELSYRTRALAVHVLARSDLFHLATDDPRSGLQRLQMRPTGAGEFSDRTEPAFPSLNCRIRDWS